MKHKISVVIFATLFLFSIPSKISSEQCIDFTRGNQIKALLGSMKPASWMVNDGVVHIVDTGSSIQLLENINATVQISADTVVVDLNGFKIKSSNSPVIQIDADQKNIVIKNGSIEGIRPEGSGTVPAVGVLIKDGAKSVHLENLNITHCFKGIHLEGTPGNKVECCTFTNCFINDCEVGVDMVHANKCVFQDCDVCECNYKGFSVVECMYNKFIQCKAIRVGPGDLSWGAYPLDGLTAGFAALGGKDNLFYECFAEAVCKTDAATEWCRKAMGFWFGFEGNVPETESKIVNCFVDSIKGAGFGNAFGINLEMKLRDSIVSIIKGDFIPDNEGSAIDIDWSPQGEYVAVVTYVVGTIHLRVFRFDGSTFGQVFSTDFDSSTFPVGVEFSPDGQLLAIVYGGAAGSLKVYRVSDFNELVSLPLDPDPTDVKWFHCGRTLAVTRAAGQEDDPELSVFYFDGDELILIKDVSIPGVDGAFTIAISPDDKYIAVGDSAGDLYIIEVASWTVVEGPITGAGTLIDFNPVACCGKYYIASSGPPPNSHYPLFIYEFDSNAKHLRLITSLESTFAPLSDLEWLPDGKSLAVAGATSSPGVYVYKFNPQTKSLSLALSYDGASLGPATANRIAISPCIRYMIISGDEENEVDTEFVALGYSVNKCVVENCRVANVKGGLCGIGIIGGGACNLIDANLLYGSCVNASEGVFNTFCDYRYANTSHKPQPLENLSFSNLACNGETCCSNVAC